MKPTFLAACAATLSVLSTLAASSGQAATLYDRLNVFGDSYSSTTFRPYRKWWQDFPAAKSVYNFALGGSTGAYYGSGATWSGRMVTEYLGTVKDHVPLELTVVYYGGGNDMTRKALLRSFTTVAKEFPDFAGQVRRLINVGLTAGDRRIFLVQGHDWSRNPRWHSGTDARYATSVHTGQLEWNVLANQFANSHYHVVAVDMFTAMECVYRHPDLFGFKNVTDRRPDGVPAEDYLYALYDNTHFDGKGQALIQQVFLYYVSQGVRVSKEKLLADMAAGRVFTNIPCS